MPIKFPILFELFSGTTSFFGNEKACNELVASLKKGADTLLIGSRSSGRGDVLNSALRTLPESTLTIRVDGAFCVDDNDFVHELFSSMRDAFPEEVCDLFIHVKPPLENVYTDKNIHSAIKMIEEACVFLEKENAVVILDNFDHILNDKSLEIKNHLSKAATTKEMVSFLLCLNDKPNKEEFTWENQLTEVSVASLTLNNLKEQCESYFKISFSDEVFMMIYDALEAQKDLILRTCALLVASKKFKPSRDNCVDAIITLVNIEEDSFIDKFSHLPMRQKVALKSVSFAEGQKVFNGRILERFGMVRQSLGQSITALEKKGDLIKIAPGCYRHSNVLFGLWLHPEWRSCPRNIITRLVL